eukprot:207115-Amphidinium_carterae.1
MNIVVIATLPNDEVIDGSVLNDTRQVVKLSCMFWWHYGVSLRMKHQNSASVAFEPGRCVQVFLHTPSRRFWIYIESPKE